MIKNCIFTNITYNTCRGEPSGASICITMQESTTGKNIEVNKCTFVNNEANGFGGAVYADAHITGFSSNKFYNCRTTSENGEDYATKCEDYAVSCRSYKIKYVKNKFTKHKRTDIKMIDNSIVYIETNEKEVSPEIDSLIFNDNTGVSGLIVRSLKLTTISNI